jgi:hypothetical protein
MTRKHKHSALEIMREKTTAQLRNELHADSHEEYKIHCSIVEALERFKRPGVVSWHTENQRKRSKPQAARAKAMGLLAGVPDLIISTPESATRPARMIFMEVKAKRGRLSPEQEAFMRAMTNNGHICRVVRSLEDAMAVFTSYSVIRPARIAA